MQLETGKSMMRRKIKGFLCGCLIGIASVAQADIAVIVNPVNSGVSLSRPDIQQIFLGLQTKLSNGNTVTPFDQAQNQPIRQTFYELVAGRTPVQMKTYWSRLMFTGRGTPPQVLSDNNAIKQLVASDKNAIGYVDASVARGAAGVAIAFVIPTQ